MNSLARALSNRKTLRSLIIPGILLAITGSAAGYFAMEMTHHSSTEIMTTEERPLAIHERRDWVMAQLVAAGVTPESLAIAGVPGISIGAFIDAACEYCEDHGQALVAAQQAAATANSQARQASAPAGWLAQRGTETMTPQQAAATAASAMTDLGTERAAFVAAALQPISDTARATLQTLISHKDWDLPAEYKVLELTEAQRIALRDALTISRQHQAAGKPLDSEVSQLLTTRRSAASTAKANLDANLASVQAAWAQEQVQ